MELKQLQYFLVVAETLNFSRAAEQLYISQSGLSYQIAELEQELNAQLFQRDRRRVSLTPAGGALLPLAQKVMGDVRSIQEVAQKGFPKTEDHLPLTIAFDRTEDHFETTGITEKVARFHRMCPEVELSLRQEDSEVCTQLLLEQKLDLAFLIQHHNMTLPPPLVGRVVHRDKMVMVVRDTPDVDNWIEALERYALVLAGDHPRGITRIMRICHNIGMTPNIRSTDSIPVSFTYVQAGLGAICLPKNYFDLHRYNNMKALPIDDPAANLSHVLVWNRMTQNPSIQKMMHMFEEDGECPEE